MRLPDYSAALKVPCRGTADPAMHVLDAQQMEAWSCPKLVMTFASSAKSGTRSSQQEQTSAGLSPCLSVENTLSTPPRKSVPAGVTFGPALFSGRHRHLSSRRVVFVLDTNLSVFNSNQESQLPASCATV
jgi:hypothetical protein